MSRKSLFDVSMNLRVYGTTIKESVCTILIFLLNFGGQIARLRVKVVQIVGALQRLSVEIRREIRRVGRRCGTGRET